MYVVCSRVLACECFKNPAGSLVGDWLDSRESPGLPLAAGTTAMREAVCSCRRRVYREGWKGATSRLTEASERDENAQARGG